jgi:putative flippase GtrA
MITSTSNTFEEVTNLPQVSPAPRTFCTPLDPPIEYIANRFGGSKAKDLARFLRFAVVGISGAVIDLGLVYVLQATILPPIDYWHVAFVTTIAFCTAVISNFTWTRLWVYPDSRSRSMRRQLAYFTLISVTGGMARTLWVTFMHSIIGAMTLPLALPFIQLIRVGYVPGPHAADKFGTLISQMIAMVVVMLWNFFANRYWTYNDVE